MKEIETDLAKQIRTQILYPVLGAGFTSGCQAKAGLVPNGQQLKSAMIEQLKQFTEVYDDMSTYDLKSISRYYKELVPRKNRTDYLLNNFTNICIPEEQRKFLNINWKYIYTFNIDTAIEENCGYRNVVLPNKKCDEDVIQSMDNCVFKIHGDVNDYCRYTDSNCFIFDNEEYVQSIKSNAFMLNKLNHDFNYNNMLFIGCSLDKELDLLSIGGINNCHKGTSLYYVTNSKPDKFKEIDLNAYGITHIIIIDDYKTFYEQMYNIYMESKKIQKDDLEKYYAIKLEYLTKGFEDNIKYLYLGKMLYSTKNAQISIPNFFIDRQVIVEKLIPEMNKYTLQCICGGRISGKTYALVSIKKNIRNREVFFFDSRYSISEDTLNLLYNRTNCVLCFDSSCLSKSQFFNIQENIEKLKNNNINIVICINRSDKDIISSIKNMSRNDDINIYDLSSYFSEKECAKLNSLLAISTIPNFNFKKSILDNLLIISNEIKIKYTRQKIDFNIKNKYEMMVLILLAIKEKLTSQEFVDFGVEREIYDIYRKTTPMLDEDYTEDIEKSVLNSSRYKIYVNSKYWLLNKLGTFASNLDNHKIITDAYCEIVQKLIYNHSAKYSAIEDYIKYDIINDIFFKPERGNLLLIKSIYDELNDLLANNPQFYHQKAKCYLWHCDRSDDKLKEINSALLFAKVSKHNTEINNTNNNFKIQIALSHIEFTIALIYAKKNSLLEYKDNECFKEAIPIIRNALYSPYNKEYCKSLLKKNGKNINDIKQYINYLMCSDLSERHLSSVEKQQVNEIVNMFMKLNKED
jgi:hypothetical protein